MKILIIHGPNLGLLGTREPEIYGTTTLDDINQMLREVAEIVSCELEFLQSDHEGDIVQAIGRTNADGIVINPAAYTHTSVAIADALSAVGKPAVEVHLSNIYKREEWRHRSYIAPVVIGQISGFGAESYVMALEYLLRVMD